MSDFASQWAQFHPLGPPEAQLLRHAEPERWVRFHSLPLSKRSATSKREKWTVLERANRIACKVLGENSSCWLVQAEADYGPAANDADTYGTIAEYQLSLEFEHYSIEDECIYRIFAAPVIWRAGAFNDLIAKCADDGSPSTMWVSVATGALFAPYEGGTDVFLPTATDVATLRREFPNWLSDRPDGL